MTRTRSGAGDFFEEVKDEHKQETDTF